MAFVSREGRQPTLKRRSGLLIEQLLQQRKWPIQNSISDFPSICE